MMLRRVVGTIGLTLGFLFLENSHLAASANGQADSDVSGRSMTANLGFSRSIMTLTLAELDTDQLPHPFVLDPAKFSFRIADQRGDQIILSPRETETVQSSHDTASLTYRLPQELPAATYTLSYLGPTRLQNLGGENIVITDITDQSLYYPERDEAQFQAMRNAFLGKRVYGYPNVAIDCKNPTNTLQNKAAVAVSARIVDIVSYEHLTLPVYLDIRPSIRIVASNPSFITINPIIITFGDLEPADTIPGRQRSGTAPCMESIRVLADTWQVYREFTLRSAADHTEWPADLRAAIAAGLPAVGMTPEMLAYVWGFPPQLGTVDDLEKLNVWNYGEGTSTAQATFANGHLISFREPQSTSLRW
jgi:hypothetical protein